MGDPFPWKGRRGHCHRYSEREECRSKDRNTQLTELLAINFFSQPFNIFAAADLFIYCQPFLNVILEFAFKPAVIEVKGEGVARRPYDVINNSIKVQVQQKRNQSGNKEIQRESERMITERSNSIEIQDTRPTSLQLFNKDSPPYCTL